MFVAVFCLVCARTCCGVFVGGDFLCVFFPLQTSPSPGTMRAVPLGTFANQSFLNKITRLQ